MLPRAVLAVSAVLVVLVVVGDHRSMIGPVIVLWFLCVAPGMAVARVLPLADRKGAAAWAIAVGTSFAIDVLVTEAMVYAHIWNASRSLIVLAVFVLALLVAENLGRARSPEHPTEAEA